MIVDETADNKIVRKKAREDAMADIASETLWGSRRGVNSPVLKKSLENVQKNTDVAYKETEEQIKKKGSVGGSRVIRKG